MGDTARHYFLKGREEGYESQVANVSWIRTSVPCLWFLGMIPLSRMLLTAWVMVFGVDEFSYFFEFERGFIHQSFRNIFSYLGIYCVSKEFFNR